MEQTTNTSPAQLPWRRFVDEDGNPYWTTNVPNHADPEAAAPSTINLKMRLVNGEAEWYVEADSHIVIDSKETWPIVTPLMSYVESLTFPTIEDLKRKKTELIDQASVLNDQIKELTKKQYFVCPERDCGHKTPIGELAYIQTHWYVHPYSCSGGDYYNEGHGVIKCPKCGEGTQLTGKFKYLADHKSLFKEVIKQYDRD